MSDVVDKQDLPHPGVNEISPLLIRDMEEKAARGAKKYGLPLESFNGRDAVKDAYQEVLDLAMYLRQTVEEDLHGRTVAAIRTIRGAIVEMASDSKVTNETFDKYYQLLTRAACILEGVVEI
jgi:hypothetical protein